MFSQLPGHLILLIIKVFTNVIEETLQSNVFTSHYDYKKTCNAVQLSILRHQVLPKIHKNDKVLIHE